MKTLLTVKDVKLLVDIKKQSVATYSNKTKKGKQAITFLLYKDLDKEINDTVQKLKHSSLKFSWRFPNKKYEQADILVAEIE